MNGLVEMLRRLNRKERFYLLADAIVGEPTFPLSKQFRLKLSGAIGVAVPPQALACMDYHLDWIYAALVMTSDPNRGWYEAPVDHEGHAVNINANQEDIDLLVAFNVADTTHVVLLEAKGVTAWSNAQLTSKARRLRQIFEPGSGSGDGSGGGWPDVRPYFVLTSPGETPPGVSSDSWPTWMTGGGGKLRWMPLPIAHDLVQVERYDRVHGRRSRTGTSWRVRPTGQGDVPVTDLQNAETINERPTPPPEPSVVWTD